MCRGPSLYNIRAQVWDVNLVRTHEMLADAMTKIVNKSLFLSVMKLFLAE